MNQNLSIYEPGEENLYSVATVYPPLQPILLGFFTKIFSLRVVELLGVIIFAPFVGILLFNLFLDLTLKLNFKNINIQVPKSICLLITASIFYFSKGYINYLSELKPDSVALIFLLLSIYCISDFNNFKKKKDVFPIVNLKRLFLLFICLFAACITKQQFILPSLLIGIYISLLRRSILYFLIILAAPLLSILIPSAFFAGYFKMVILAHIGRGYGGLAGTTFGIINSIFTYIFGIIGLIFLSTIFINLYNSRNNFQKSIYISSTPISANNFYLNLNKIFSRDNLSSIKMYVNFIFFSFFFSQLLSSYNYGGNAGNFEVGIMPLLIFNLPNIISINYPKFKKFYSNYYIDKCYINVLLISLFSFSFISSLFINTHVRFLKSNNYFYVENTLIPKFEKLYDNSKFILVDGDSSLLSLASGYSNQMSITHMMHLDNGKMKNSNKNIISFISSKQDEFPFIIKRSFNEYLTIYVRKHKWLKNLEVLEEECHSKSYCTGLIRIK